jgi:hypothetical protein
MPKQTNINVKNVIFTLITTTHICETNTTNQKTEHFTQTTLKLQQSLNIDKKISRTKHEPQNF